MQSPKYGWIHPNINFTCLSLNSNALDLLEQHFNEIFWYNLSLNSDAIHLLEQNLDKIHWSYLSKNPSGTRILEKNINEIDWGNLSKMRVSKWSSLGHSEY